MKTPSDATVIVDSYKRASKHDPGSNSYMGLRIHALGGLHEFIAEKALEYFKPRGSLLDLGAGTGALSLRLINHGFIVSSADYVAENFKLASVRFTKADLNGPFAMLFAQQFDAIVATEIIEHLENPRHFMRECHDATRLGGRIIITTPNTGSSASIALFMRCGYFDWFDDTAYEVDGHITPMFAPQLDKILTETGFRMLWQGTFGAPKRFKRWPKMELLRNLVFLVSGKAPRDDGEVAVFIAEKCSTRKTQA